MIHPFLARRMNRMCVNEEAERLPATAVQHADVVVRGLYLALRAQTEPAFQHPVRGWGLTSTSLEAYGDVMGTPAVILIGHRTIYLSAAGDTVRVLTMPHPRKFDEERVIQVARTTVPALLQEDPTLYYGLLNAVDESIAQFNLDYQYETPSLPRPPEPTT